MNKESHWENIYTARPHTDVSWFTEHIDSSLELIKKSGIRKSDAIIDVGGGASTLVDDLIADGFTDLSVIDISAAALQVSQKRLQEKAEQVKWIVADILVSDFGNREYALWHDRAAFHFLTSERERAIYKDKVAQHLQLNGYLLISVFANDGPLACSALEIKRHSESDIRDYFGDGYLCVHQERSIHTTPTQAEQKFVNVLLKRIK